MIERHTEIHGKSPADDAATLNHSKTHDKNVARSPHGVAAKLDVLRAHLLASVAKEDGSISILQQLQDTFHNLIDENQRLADMLDRAKSQITELLEKDRHVSNRSFSGTFIKAHDDGTIDVLVADTIMRVNVSPAVDIRDLRPGQQVVLDDAHIVSFVLAYDAVGEVMTLREVLDDGERAWVTSNTAKQHIAKLSKATMKGSLRAGNSVLVEHNSRYIIERIPVSTERWFLDEIPNVGYNQIGGLADQISQVREAVELPYLHSDLYERFQLRPPNGILLYGPVGCGKTMIAKAMANSLASEITARTGKNGRSHFITVKCPDLLDKYVGETERRLRLVFQRARETSQEGMPVIVFFDELDAVFPMRESGSLWGMEQTLVPQLLCEIDALEGMRNVLFVATSNHASLIDPAILRPGRIDIKIRIDRPDAHAATEIFLKYLTEDLPIHSNKLTAIPAEAPAAIIEFVRQTVDYLYKRTSKTTLFEITYANGDKDTIYLADVNSGVIIKNIANRAKSAAVRRFLRSGSFGISIHDLLQAADEEITDIRNLSSAEEPGELEWITSRKAERIVYIKRVGLTRSEILERFIKVTRYDLEQTLLYDRPRREK